MSLAVNHPPSIDHMNRKEESCNQAALDPLEHEPGTVLQLDFSGQCLCSIMQSIRYYVSRAFRHTFDSPATWIGPLISVACSKERGNVEAPLPDHGCGNYNFEILRETGEGADWHNRYVQHPETNVLPHYTKLI
jgi:hypothetical protein